MRGFPALRRTVLGLLLVAPGCRDGDGGLPPGADLGPYSDIGRSEEYRGPRLYTYMDGGADIFFEYGFAAVWVRRYQRDGREFVAELFEMRDDAAAAGIYSYMRRPGRESVIAGGCRASLTDTQVQVARGRFFLVCRLADPMADDGVPLRDLCVRLVGRLEGVCEEGRLFTGLPREGRVSGTEVFLAGPVGLNIRAWLAPLERTGFKHGWLSDYEAAGESAEVLLAEYDSPTGAGRAGQGFTDCALPGCVLLHRGVRVVIVHGPHMEGDRLHGLAERLISTPMVQPSSQNSSSR